MNKILTGLVIALSIAVAFLFYKVYSGNDTADLSVTGADSTAVSDTTSKVRKAHVEQIATPPTGKIAYIDIDRLYEESSEADDLIAESNRSMSKLEARFESLSREYGAKVEEIQRAQQAGILPDAELEVKAKEIQRVENEAKNVQLMMDNQKMQLEEKSAKYRLKLKEFLVKWNQGRYDFILSYSEAVPSMLLGNSSLEVTDEVIKVLNEEYKTAKTKK